MKYLIIILSYCTSNGMGEYIYKTPITEVKSDLVEKILNRLTEPYGLLEYITESIIVDSNYSFRKDHDDSSDNLSQTEFNEAIKIDVENVT